jgi:uncharacterized protein (TIGR01777 family)
MTTPRHVVIAGGTGFLGRSLAAFLTARGDRVTVLGRSAKRAGDPWRHVAWDARTVGPWADTLADADAIVNLAGRTVDCVKTPDHCDEILRSRVESTTVLGDALAVRGRKPRVWVQMSTAHIYGDPPLLVCTEGSAPGYGLAPIVGQAWEAAFEKACPVETRGVVLRTSFVLGRAGGAFPTLRRLARFGLGGAAGHGRQGISWIHEHDMNRLFARAIDRDDMTGMYVATSPSPVSNAEFMRTLRHALRMPVGLPAPAILVRLGAALVLRTDPELVLYGRYCVSRRLAEEGFTFEFPDVTSAVLDLVRAS